MFVPLQQDAPEDPVPSPWDPRTLCQWQLLSPKPSMPISKAQIPASKLTFPCSVKLDNHSVPALV